MTKRKRAEMTEHNFRLTIYIYIYTVFQETSNKQFLTVDGRSFFFPVHNMPLCHWSSLEPAIEPAGISAFNCARKFALCHRHSLHMVFACTLILRKHAPWTCFRPYSYFHQRTGNSKGARVVSSSLYSKLVKRSSSFVETRNKSWRFFMRLLLNPLI